MASVELYKVASSPKIKHEEEELAKELTDLQNDIEENEMLGGGARVARYQIIQSDNERTRSQEDSKFCRVLLLQNYVRPDSLPSCNP